MPVSDAPVKKMMGMKNWTVTFIFLFCRGKRTPPPNFSVKSFSPGKWVSPPSTSAKKVIFALSASSNRTPPKNWSTLDPSPRPKSTSPTMHGFMMPFWRFLSPTGTHTLASPALRVSDVKCSSENFTERSVIRMSPAPPIGGRAPSSNVTRNGGGVNEESSCGVCANAGAASASVRAAPRVVRRIVVNFTRDLPQTSALVRTRQYTSATWRDHESETAHLPEADPARDRGDDLRRVKSHARLEYRVHLPNVPDRRRGISGDDHEIRLLADGKAADPGVSTEVLGAVQGADGDRFERREPRLDEQLRLALVGVAGNDAARPGRIRAGHEQAAR